MERGGLRGGAGVVASSASDATTVDGVTPTAAGLAILGGADAAAQRTSLGGSLGRVPLVHAATTAPTVNDDSSDGYSVGDIWNDTTGNRTYIADSVGVGAADWRSLQSDAIKRITGTVIGGAFVAYGETWIGGAWVQITPSVSPTVTGDPDGLGGTGSGTTITWSTGSAIIATNVATEVQYVGWAFADIAAGLGLDQPRPVGIRVEISSATVTSGGASDYANLFGAFGTSGALATNMQYAIGIRCPNTGNAAIRAVAAVTGLGSTGSATSTIRRVFYSGPTPIHSAQIGSVYATDVADVFENVLNIGTSPGVTGTPTHFFVAFGASTTQRATVINGPFVRFYV